MKRTDIHRPSAIIPAEYTYVGQECIKIEGMGDCYAQIAMRERIAAHMKQTGGTYASHSHGGNCMVCGSVNAIYTVLFHHVPTNTYVRMGQDCAVKCDMGGDFKDSAFRKAVDDARHAHAGKRKAQAILSDDGLGRAWEVYTATPEPGVNWPYEEQTVIDIVGKLVQYGNISTNALSYLRTLINKIGTRAQRQAEYEARKKDEALNAADCPTGRIDVEGVILSTRQDETDYGVVTKVLLKTDAGYKLWGTLPVVYGTSINDRVEQLSPGKGDRISFRATVTPSDKDSKFGFYSRPTGGRLVVGEGQGQGQAQTQPELAGVSA